MILVVTGRPEPCVAEQMSLTAALKEVQTIHYCPGCQQERRVNKTQWDALPDGRASTQWEWTVLDPCLHPRKTEMGLTDLDSGLGFGDRVC